MKEIKEKIYYEDLEKQKETIKKVKKPLTLNDDDVKLLNIQDQVVV